MKQQMTYTKCELCNSTLQTAVFADQYGDPPGWNRPCPCTKSSTPGWSATGLTVGQIDRALEAERSVPKMVAALTAAIADCELTARALSSNNVAGADAFRTRSEMMREALR